MTEPFIGEIRIFAGYYAPAGWAFCNGQLLFIGENAALYSVLGTTYGGDGITTFALPDLRGRTPLEPGRGPGLSSRGLGETGGAKEVTLTGNELPPHTHSVTGVVARAHDGPGNNSNPAGRRWASPQREKPYANPADTVMASSAAQWEASSPAGAHDNMPPYLALNFIIALQGFYPA